MAYFQTDNLWVNRLPDGVADLVLDVAGGKVNVLNPTVLTELDTALERVAEDATFRLLLLRSGKAASFCAGLAPKALAGMSPVDLRQLAARGQAFCLKIAQLRLPTVAIISGGCLGGGLELALACDYRVAVNKPTTILGFPDLELGLIPMWGGTQRLPKLVGLERGLQMLLGGRRLSPQAAKTWGLIDEVTEEANAAPPAFLSTAQKRVLAFLPLRTWREKTTESTALGRWLLFRGAARLLRSRLPDDMPAPWRALEAVRTGLRQGMEAGLAREAEDAAQLAQTEAFQNLVHLHAQRDRFRAAVAQGTESHRPRAVGVIGGNRAGALVHMLVTKGYSVVIRERTDAALGNTLFHMLAVFQQEVTRGGMSQAELMRNLRNIHGTTAWKGFEDLDLVLDASEDDPESKKALFRELEEHTSAQAVLVTTAPGVRVTQVQEGSTRPERVAGLQFLAPAGRSLLVEVVSSDRTHADVSHRLEEFVASLGRVPWLVKDTPGLLLGRLLIPYLNEAILLVKEGLDPARVEEAMLKFGVTQGPLEYLDVIGWDVARDQAEALGPVLQARLVLDETFVFMARQQWLGRKTGVGFYRYRRKRKRANHALIARLRGTSHAEAPHTMEAMSRTDQLARARQRLVLLMVNEAAWCVAEGRAQSPEAVDLALMLAGWAPHRGGPLHYARHIGIDAVLDELDELAATHGPRYEPCPVLRALVGASAR